MPKGLVENLAKSCVLTVYHAYHPELVRIALEEGLYDGLLSEMLTEAEGEEGEAPAGPVFSDEDANNLQTQIEGINTLIDGFETVFAGAEDAWAEVVETLHKYAGDLPDTATIVDMIHGDDPKAAGKKSAELTEKLQILTGDIAAIIGAIQALQKDLGNFKVEDESQTIADLANNSTDPNTFPKLDGLQKGIQKAYQIPGWFDKVWASGSKAAEAEATAGGGFFKKAAAFIGGLFKNDSSGRVVEADALSKAIMATSFKAFKDSAGGIQKMQDSLTSTSEEIANDTTQVNMQAQQPSGGEAPTGAPAADPAAAIQQAAEEPEAPGVAIANALDAWKDGMAATSQKTLMARGRFDALKTGIDDTLTGISKAVEDQVRTAVADWREKFVGPEGAFEKEPKKYPLGNQKNFSKKNWDSLETLVPKLASSMLQKKNESIGRFTVGTIHRAVHRYLDDTYLNNDVIFESRRWGTLAGIGENNEKS